MRFILISLVLFGTLYSNISIAEEFTVWLDGLKQEAKEAGISDDTITATINHIVLIPSVIKLDRAQPEFISPFFDYYYQRVDANKIARGRAILMEHESLLNEVELKYGVPKSILVAFWGMETNYGSYQGDIDTFSTLATLAYDGRRADFFRGQLLDAMRIVDAGNANMDELRGSWAGAFGHMQFMPTTFITYAVDGDEDGRIDIVNSEADAFASAANYLSQAGWREDEPAIIEVQLPENFQWQNAQLILRKSVKDWSRLGVRVPVEVLSVDDLQKPQPKVVKTSLVKRKSGKQIKALHKNLATSSPLANKASLSSLPLPTIDGYAAIILPQGWRGPAFMVFDNFDVIMDWNRSVNYALSVAQLAKRINGEPRILGGQFAEVGALTFEQMFELQTALNELGFDAGEPDGFPGLRTQAAIRAYQLAQHLPADAYASPSVYESVMQQRVYDVMTE
ncbi:MAG TPA: lytic murein transglycosylase [Methylotenera sp.]|nr:lytic murein transglycosylase [Methylotenera sp.]